MAGLVALITGASSGIGAGTAIYFASKGCHLALTGRSSANLQETVQSCIKSGAKEDTILTIVADFEQEEDIKQVVDKTIEKFGKMDILINNAGLTTSGIFEDLTMENYDRIMNVNLRAVFQLTQLALPHLISSKGSIVNVSSIASQRYNRNNYAYKISKAGLDHFTRTLALDMATKNVRVNAINPSAVKTNILRDWENPVVFEDLAKIYHAMERLGTVEEMAMAIWFLADNDQSSFITGVTLLVDGGAFLKGPQPWE